MHRFMKLGPGIFWVWIAILSEGLGGVLVALGLFGPFPAATLAADLTVVTILAHVPKGFWVGNGGWEFPVPLAAGALAIGLIGNGRYSLDSLLGLTYPDTLVGVWWIVMAAGVVLALILRAIFAPKAAAKAA